MGFAGGGGATVQRGAGMRGASGPKPSLRQAFVALKHPHYRSLWYSQIASFTGMQMQQVARGLLAFQLTGSYTAVGVVMMAWGVPQLLFSLVGGAVADRVNKRTVILACQGVTGILTLANAILISTGHINIPLLFAFGLVQGTAFAFNMPARQALVAELVPQNQLMNGIALNNVAMNATRIVGPAVAGMMIGWWGIAAAFYAQAFLFLFVLGFLFRLPPSTTHLAGAAQRGSILKEIGIGLRYIGGHRTLLMLMLMAFVPTVLGMPYMSLLPGFAVAELNLEAGSYGFMFTITGIGAIVGSIFIASMTEFSRKPLLQVGIGFGYGAALIALGVGSLLWGYAGALGALMLLGLFSTTYQTLNNTMVMAETRPEFYGRVMSVYMLTFAVFPLMSGPAGVLADHISAKTTFMAAGAGIIAFIALCLILNPKYVFRRSGASEDASEGAEDAAPSMVAQPAGMPPAAALAAVAPTANGYGGAYASDGAGAQPRRRPARRRNYMGIGGVEVSTDYMSLAPASNGASRANGGSYGLENGGPRRLERYGLVSPDASNGAAHANGANGGAAVDGRWGTARPALYGLPVDGGAPRASGYGLADGASAWGEPRVVIDADGQIERAQAPVRARPIEAGDASVEAGDSAATRDGDA